MKPHKPVMVEEYLKYFEDSELKVFFDGTLGAAGHAEAILSEHPEIEIYIGCDRDESALEIAKDVLKPWENKVKFVHGNFSDLDEILDELKIESVDGFFLT